MGEKLGIKETKEVLDFVESVLSDLKQHKSDDGKISMSEWMQTAMSNTPSAVKAFMGVDKVDDELKDLDEAEIKELALRGVSLAKAVLGLVGIDAK